MSNTTRTTSNSSSGYDERYVVPLEASRRGAHRARVSPVMAMLPVVAVVGIVVGAIALVYVFFGGGGGSGDPAAPPVAGPTVSAPAPSPSASGEASGGAPSPSPDEASPTAAAGTVDKTIPVAVYNGSGTSGLGKQAGNKLTAVGWKLGTVANWTGAAVTETTVYYGSADQRASAQAIVKTLRKGVAKQSAAKAGAGITVVVGPDYPGAGGGNAAGNGSSSTSTRSHSSSSPHASSPAAGGGRTPTPAPTQPGTPADPPASPAN